MDRSNIDQTGEPVQPEQIDRWVEVSPTPVNPFRRLWDLGYRRLVPIVSPAAELSPHSNLAKRPACRGKAVGELGDYGWKGLDWHTHVATEADLDRWFAMGAGVGTRTGAGLMAIDIDTIDPAQASAAVQAALEILGPAPRRIGRAPKVLLPYRTDPDVDAPYQRVEFVTPFCKLDERGNPVPERVEILGKGRQYVTGGIHPTTLRPYSWPDGVPPFDELTLVSPEQIQAYFDRLLEIMPQASQRRPSSPNTDRNSIDQTALHGELGHIRHVVEAMPNDAKDREGWINLGYALKAALPDNREEAFELWWEHSLKWNPDKSYDAVWREWTSFGEGPFEIGASAIDGMASKATRMCMAPATAFFDVVDVDSVDTSGFADVLPRNSAAGPRNLAFVKLSDWAGDALTARARPLIKGLLDQGAMTVLYGESNVGKTFVTMDLAFHIAKGMPWGGMKTTRKVAAYVAAEGGQGARKRGAALLSKYGVCDDFHILPVPVDLLRSDGDLQPLIRALRSLGDDLGLVVIDTLSRALAGGDENSSTDMGAVVRHLDAIRSAVSAHVLIVHHTGKDKARGARGHSLLRAATDTEIEVAEKQIIVTKQRDLEKSYASAFDLDVVTLGKDEDGDPVTSCTLRLVARRAEVAPGLATPTEQQILDGLEACADTAANPGAGVLQAELVAFFGRPEFGPEKLRFHLREMLKKNLVERVSRGCWRTRCPNENSVTTWFEPQNAPVSPERSGGSPPAGSVFD